MPESLAAARSATESRFWRGGGLIYYNPADGALMVPKREGLGYTLNFGRPVAWVLMAAILLIPIALPLLIHTSKH